MSRSGISACACALVLLAALPAWADEIGPRRVEFTTADGVQLVGDFYPPTDKDAPAAILLHMYKHDRSTWKPLIGPLRRAGFTVLAIDLRGHGESVKPKERKLKERVDERDSALFNAMHRDVAAAVKWVRAQPGVNRDRLVLIGASVGCSVAIDYLARDQTVDAVICLTPGENYLGVDTTAHIKKSGGRPVLLLATADERKAAESLAKLADNVTAEIVGPGRHHGTRMLAAVKDVKIRIVKFATEAVRHPQGP